MNWVTQAEAVEAAKTRKGAIECTRKKWRQVCRATKKELIANDYKLGECALCWRYFFADLERASCPLPCGEPDVCCPEWQAARYALHNWSHDQSPENWRKWGKAKRAVLARLERIK